VHPRLERQVRSHFGSVDAVPKELEPLLATIDAEYRAADEDRALLERAMALSSEELVKRNIELTSAYARLQELDSFRTQFINNAAHELGTPLTPIKIQVHLLRQAMRENATPQSEKSIATLQRNLDRLADLVRDVLDAARLQSDRFKLEVAPFPLGPLVTDIIDTFEPQATQAGVKLELSLPERLAREPVLGDQRRLSQVLFNLLSNALKFTPAGGHVRVRVEADAREATIRVADTGQGIRKERIVELFRPFSQVHDTMLTRGGTGLGLYISKGIVEGSGGRIWAESDGLGHGATFAFTVPRVE